MKLTFRLPSQPLVRCAFLGMLLMWTFVAGKDVSWDVRNHQFYLPFSWLTGRFRTDLFAAGPQSYQNPLGYFPPYALLRLGLPAWVMGAILATLHALVIWPLDRIAGLFWPRRSDEDFWLRTLALAFCCFAPIFLEHIGTTAMDPLTSLLVLWAVALSLEPTAPETSGLRGAFVVGACLGVASAAKLSNAPFAVVLGMLWLLQWAVGQRNLRQVAVAAAGLVASFALTAGPWMWWLWQDFGNPIFPLYNNVFHSPYAPRQPILALRFIPTSFAGAVSRLWELGKLSGFVSYEAFLPDIRPALAAGAAAVAALVLLLRGGWRRAGTMAAWRSPGAQLAVFLLLSYVMWIRSSGNGRYGMPLLVLAGIGLVRAVQLAVPVKAAKVLLLTALVLQCAYYGHEGQYRSQGVAWDSGPYIEYRVPQRLRDQPYLHLSLDYETHASIAPFLDPRGALANPIGQFGLPTDGPLGQRFETLLARWHGRTRVLIHALPQTDDRGLQHMHQAFQALLYRFGLDVDWRDCEPIEMVVSASAASGGAAGASNGTSPNMPLQSCAVIDRPQRDPVVEAQLADANKVFAILEAACPVVFSPTPFVSEHGAGLWERHYMNSDAVLSVSVTNGVLYAHFRQINVQYFGSIDDILQHRTPISCPTLSFQTPM